MNVIHIVTTGVHPQPGGMELVVLNMARHLAEMADTRVVVYARRQPSEYRRADEAHRAVEVVYLAGVVDMLLEPLMLGNRRLSEADSGVGGAENYRVQYLSLRNAVTERVSRRPEAKHVLISVFVSSSGFIAQQVALELGMPHIASVSGSDISRDMRNPLGHGAIRHVVEEARLVVTNNREQAETLASVFTTDAEFATIHNAMTGCEALPLWSSPGGETVRLFSDCGFQLNKGTHILLQAVADLTKKGLPVSLTLAGGIDFRAREYWERVRDEYSLRYPDTVVFPGRVTPPKVTEMLCASHIYCSATLGEGCSLSRIRALAMGIPIVTTRCGALPEFAGNSRHVRLCPPGDLTALTEELRMMVAGVKDDAVAPDADEVAGWRRHFSPNREGDEWRRVVARVLSAPAGH